MMQFLPKLIIPLMQSNKNTNMMVTLERCSNKTSLHLFPHRDTNLTTRYEPKYLCENSRNQLRNCSTLSECMVKAVTLKRVRRATSRDHSPPTTTAPPQLAQLSLVPGFSLRGGEKEENGFLESYLRDQFLSHLIWSTNRTGIIWMP